jgi:hypothetical protein
MGAWLAALTYIAFDGVALKRETAFLLVTARAGPPKSPPEPA